MNMRSIRRTLYRALPEALQEKAAQWFVAGKIARLQRQDGPTALVFFVTSRCNARCAHCFYWQELNRKTDELTLDEIARIAASLPSPVYLSLTGGEPFLRDDLPDICRIFSRENRCRNIGIATNGFLTDRIVSLCRDAAASLPLDALSVQVSLDGLAATHDVIRRVPGGFDRAMETVRQLSRLAAETPVFSVHVSMTLQNRNMDEAEELVDTLLPLRVPVRFALVRGQHYGTYCLPGDVANEIDPREEDAPVVEMARLREFFDRLRRKNKESVFPFWSELQQEKIRLSLAMIEEKKRQLPCYAGKIDAVLYANGDVAMCELTRPFANVREFGCDMKKLWRSPGADWTRERIRRCFCIHGCNLSTSMMFEPRLVQSLLTGR